MKRLMGNDEMAFLSECVEEAPAGNVVELGAYQGGSTAAIARVANERGLPFTTIDNFSYARYGASGPGVLRQNLENAGVHPIPTIIAGNSTRVPVWIDSVACLFVDTDHRAAQLNAELDAWLPLLVEGGIIVLHDYNWPARFPEMIEVIDARLGDSEEWERVGLMRHTVAFRRDSDE